jgi:hypothetical protein
VISPWVIRRTFPLTRVRATTKDAAVALTLIFALTFVGSLVIALRPGEARAVGSIGVVIAALAFWTAILSLFFVAAPLRLGLPGLAVLSPLPWLVASYIHDPNQFPRRATLEAPPPIEASKIAGIEEQFVRWLLSRKHAGEGPIPVYLISAEGGGLRGAYWTARVLAELNARSATKFAQHSFAYSGVSGGSLGVAAFMGIVRKHPVEGIRIVETMLGRDYLAPLVGRLLLAEPFWQLLGSYSKVVPRDVSFERQWESDWQAIEGSAYFSRPFLDVFGAGFERPGPAVIFNATNSETGKRVLLANIDAGVVQNDYLLPLSTAGVRDLLGDVTVGEVVHLSARFPFISPPASLQMLVPTPWGK